MDKFFTNAERVSVYAEGKRAFEGGRQRAYNPYAASKELAGLWWHGWDTAEGKNKAERSPFEENITYAQRESVYGEGELAFKQGRQRAYNPHATSASTLEQIWWNGWDHGRRRSKGKDHHLTNAN